MLWNSFSARPVVVVWEMTRACRLACVHCRASAQPARSKFELSTREAKRLIEQVVEASPKLFILSGGDPSRREDLVELVSYAADRGLRVALSPSATPDFLSMNLDELRDAGVACMSFSLDGATEESHNRFRGVYRAWEWTMKGLEAARTAKIPVQINSTITSGNIREFDDMVKVVEKIDPAVWSIFMVVPTGRAQKDQLPAPDQVEELFHKLVALSRKVSFRIKTTEGPQYRRIALQEGCPDEMGSTLGINDGRGFVFVSHKGNVCPSGFLPLVAGNVRRTDLLDVYQNAPIFHQLRNPSLLKGKCGRCEFKTICGGSRARAFAMTGDYLAQEPLCPHQPANSL